MYTDLMHFYMCCKEQYCIGTWNVRSMNQGKLEVVKQEMARVNVDILGFSKLKGTGMGEFTQMTIISTTAGRNPLEEMEKQSKEESKMQYLDAISKKDRMISVHFQGKPFNIIVIQVCAPITNTEEAEVEHFYDDLQDLLEQTPRKRCPS